MKMRLQIIIKQLQHKEQLMMKFFKIERIKQQLCNRWQMISINQMLSTIEKITGQVIPYERISAIKEDVLRTNSDFSYLNSLIHIIPKIDTEIGIKNFYSWASLPKIKNNLEKIAINKKKWAINNKEKKLHQSRSHYKNNSERYKELNKSWKIKNRGQYNFLMSKVMKKRQIINKNAIPKWFENDKVLIVIQFCK